MTPWEFWDYIEANGNNPFANWLSELAIEVQAHIANRMVVMEGMSVWPEKWASSYKGKSGLLELRLPFRKVQYRPLYCFSPHIRKQLVLLAGAIEKGGKIPSSVLKAATQRLEILREDASHAARHTY